MPGSPLSGSKGVVIGIHFYDSNPQSVDYLHRDEYSCMVSLDDGGLLTEKTIRAKWLKLLSKG